MGLATNNGLPLFNNTPSEQHREFWNHIEAIATQVDQGILPDPPSLFRDPSERPRGAQIKVLLKTVTRITLVGIIFDNGTPGIYDFCSDRYIKREDWDGIAGWMPLPE
jgi:hypothetical protein